MPMSFSASQLFGRPTLQSVDGPGNAGLEAAFKITEANNVDPRQAFIKGLFDRVKQDESDNLSRGLFVAATGQDIPQRTGIARALFGQTAPDADQLKLVSSILENRSQADLRNAQMRNLADLADARDKTYSLKQQQIEEKLNQQGTFMNWLQQAQAGGQGFAPGTTMSMGPNGVRINQPLNRKYTESENKAIGQAETLLSQINKLDTLLSNKKAAVLPDWMLPDDSDAESYKTALDDVRNTLLYLKSGAAISPQEYNRLSKNLPSFWRGDRADREQLERFKTEYRGIINRIRGGSNADTAPDGGGGLPTVGSLYNGEEVLSVEKIG